MKYDFPHGFVLSESALYAYVCQDVFPDVVSFAAAIPDHLKPLFLIPIKVQFSSAAETARRVARRRVADGMTPTGDTEEAELFGTSTFVQHDNEPTVPSSEPGSIFRQDDADSLTHHQEYDYDQNVQAPTDTSFNDDIELKDLGLGYPYRTDEKVRHSSAPIPHVMILRLRVAKTSDDLENHVPSKIKTNAESCSVSLVSYDKRTRVFTFSVDCGNGAKQVQAKMSEIDQVSMSCNCPFWRWNGPEFHAKENSFMLGAPFGTASPPNVRDPDRQYWLCKHAYAVIRRLDKFVQDVVDENWDKDEDQLMDAVDEEWDRLEGTARVPLEETEDDDIELDIDWGGDDPLEPEESEGAEKSEGAEEDDGSVDVDLSELEEPEQEEIEDYEVDLSELEEPEQEEIEDYEVDLSELEEPEQEPEDYETPSEPEQEPEDYETPDYPEVEPGDEPIEEDYETPDEEDEERDEKSKK